VVGDYDVDGVSAAALIATLLRRGGAVVEVVLPRRDRDGYGLSAAHVRAARAAASTLLVAVDSGTNAADAWDEASRLALPLIVIDHHLPEDGHPRGGVLVNPRLPGSPAGLVESTAAGLALRIGEALIAELGLEIPWESLARVACLGVIADVAPLVGDNRIIAALGTAALAGARSPGLRALAKVAGLEGRVRATDVAFRLAPRLNAAGRLGSADEALELLLTRDAGRARELAELLDRRNSGRRALEERTLVEARRGLAEREEAPGLVAAWSADWHRGVVGVAAARLARELHRPTVLLAVNEERATGSGRSAAGLVLHQFLSVWSHRYERFGGHAQAVGLTVRAAELEGLRSEWEAASREWLPRLRERRLRYDLALSLGEIDDTLLASVETLEPFGAGNDEPLFRLGPLRRAGELRPFGGGHLAFDVEAEDNPGRRVAVVAWGRAGVNVEVPTEPFEMLAAVERDRYRGLRARLVEIRPVTGESSD
jgi:single-stranded-DNA-specific exonuclease